VVVDEEHAHSASGGIEGSSGHAANVTAGEEWTRGPIDSGPSAQDMTVSALSWWMP
jgi:hypothetical protein